MASSGVTLMNSGFTVLGFIDPERAISLLVTERAWCFEDVPGKVVRSPSKSLAWPRSIVLNNWVNVPFRAAKANSDVIATRMGVLNRDGFCCIFCGESASTWDHIHPQSKGGEDTWVNTAAACQSCNSKKGNKSLSEAGMKLLWEPRAPKADKDRYTKEQERINKILAGQVTAEE